MCVFCLDDQYHSLPAYRLVVRIACNMNPFSRYFKTKLFSFNSCVVTLIMLGEVFCLV